ncbi:hypothetical protein T492DRAFT_578378, partial [Pavlovales sp. CCMP2436]
GEPDTQCAICLDDFQPNQAARRMPCAHVFHASCLRPWLDRHHTCPTCRYELA